jgi:hypothetical protein
LFAVTIVPYLKIDKRTRTDGDNHVLYKYWSVPNEDSAPSHTRKITYYNDTKADLSFNLNVSGPFEIVKSKSNTAGKHPLATQDNLTMKANTMFCLQPLKIVEIDVKFKVPNVGNNLEWPFTIKNEK